MDSKKVIKDIPENTAYNYDEEEDSDEYFDFFIEETKKIKMKEPENKKDLILKYLKYLGLNKITLTSIIDIRNHVTDIIEKEDIEYCGLFQSKINLDGTTDEEHMRLFVKEHQKFKIVNFTLVRNLTSEGYWNKIQLYKDSNNKYYIFRSGINRKERYSDSDDEYLYRSFDENLKHIILYFLLKYYYPHIKYRIVPEVYYFGLYINHETSKKTFITCMEVGNITLGDYIQTIPTNYPEMRRVLFTIFRSLEIFNDLGLDFKHGDLKYNNILMTMENKPMIIDFGKSKFKLDDLLFEINDDTSAHYINPYMNVTHDMMQLLSSLFIPKRRSLLISAQSSNKDDYIIDVYEIFNFIRNKNSYILEGDVMEKVIKARYKNLFVPYQNFYLKFRMTNGVDLNELSNYAPGINFVIRSTDLAFNLGISDIEDEKIFDKYEKKYIKYKTKYIKLKNKYFNGINSIK